VSLVAWLAALSVRGRLAGVVVPLGRPTRRLSVCIPPQPAGNVMTSVWRTVG